jgi:putative PIN family toxin of toxin-antitoxin system
MKIVVDTNIYFSAFHKGGKPEAVVNRAANGLDILFISDGIMAELKKTFRKPKLGWTEERIGFIIDYIKRICQKVSIHPEHVVTDACRDIDDNIFLECAKAANADCIITGDKDLLVLKEYNGIKIITAKEYLEIVNP